MSRQWSFYSYSSERFADYFDGSVPDAARQVVDAATSDDGAWRDPAAPARVAAWITAGGIRYEGLSSADATVLDQLLPMLFAPEGLAEQWEVAPESPDGLHPSVVQELLLRAGVAVLLPVLVCGRRFEATEPSSCEYCFLTPAECERLAGEAERALASIGPCSTARLPDIVHECLIGPLMSAATKGQSLFGVLG